MPQDLLSPDIVRRLNLKSSTSKRLTPENKHPPKVVEYIVAALAPFDTEVYLIDLRRRYRATLRKKGEKAARRLAFKEARNWLIWAGFVPLLQAALRIGSAS